MPSLPHLEIVGRLAPAILIDDIGEGNTADWPEPAYGVADRQQGVGSSTWFGSIRLVDAEAVFRTLAEVAGPHLLRLPDGETGIRKT